MRKAILNIIDFMKDVLLKYKASMVHVFKYLLFIFIALLILYCNSFSEFLVVLTYILVVISVVWAIHKFVEDIILYGFQQKHLLIMLIVLALVGLTVWIDASWLQLASSYRIISLVAHRGHFLTRTHIWSFKQVSDLIYIRRLMRNAWIKEKNRKVRAKKSRLRIFRLLVGYVFRSFKPFILPFFKPFIWSFGKIRSYIITPINNRVYRYSTWVGRQILTGIAMVTTPFKRVLRGYTGPVRRPIIQRGTFIPIVKMSRRQRRAHRIRLGARRIRIGRYIRKRMWEMRSGYILRLWQRAYFARGLAKIKNMKLRRK